jgi:ribosomal protein L11 methyltransferase
MQSYAKALKTKGTLFLSGFFRDDIAALEKKCKENRLTVIEQRQKDAWCAMRCIN